MLANRAKQRLNDLGKNDRSAIADFSRKAAKRKKAVFRTGVWKKQVNHGYNRNVGFTYKQGEFEAMDMLYEGRSEPTARYENNPRAARVFKNSVQRALDNFLSI